MAFNTQKKKLKKISNDIISNSNRETKQVLTNSQINNEYRHTISSVQMFKQGIDLSTEWEIMNPLSSNTPTGVNLWKTWSYEINNIPENYLAFITVDILYRNQTSSDNISFRFADKNIFFEIEDLVGTSNKKVTVHASLYIFENPDEPLLGLLEAKLKLEIHPSNFI